MGFGENLQYLRKKYNITQEQLAEQLEVSRQSVSKWESGASFPEMEKLIQLCDRFSCSMDALLRGNLERDYQEDTTQYDRHMNTFSKMIAGGVGIVLLGVSLLVFLMTILPEGIPVVLFLCMVTAATMIFVVAGINHDSFLKKHPQIEPFYPPEEIARFDRIFTTVLASAIGLILLGVIILTAVAFIPGITDAGVLQVTALFLLFVTVSSTAIVYISLQKSKYTYAEYSKQTASPEGKKANNLVDKICGCIMLTATAIFLSLGFIWNLWHIGWVVFPIGGILCGIVGTIFSKD